jgi:uncharacterized tellurite resistance protein B-like protein
VPITPRLSRKLLEALGEEAAEDLMDWMQQVDTLRELSRQEMRADLAELRQEMSVGFAGLRQDMAHMETRLERRIADLIKWSFVFWVGAVGAIAMLAGVLC